MHTDYNYIVEYHLKNGKVIRDNYSDYSLCIETARLNFECNRDIIVTLFQIIGIVLILSVYMTLVVIYKIM